MLRFCATAGRSNEGACLGCRGAGSDVFGFSTRRFASLFAFSLGKEGRKEGRSAPLLASSASAHRSVHRPPCFFLGAALPELAAKLSSMPSSMLCVCVSERTRRTIPRGVLCFLSLNNLGRASRDRRRCPRSAYDAGWVSHK